MLTRLGRFINKLLKMLLQLGKQLNQDYMIVREAMTPFWKVVNESVFIRMRQKKWKRKNGDHYFVGWLSIFTDQKLSFNTALYTVGNTKREQF